MIRHILTLSFAFFALSAQATPQVGDYAKFSATTAITGAMALGKACFTTTVRLGMPLRKAISI